MSKTKALPKQFKADVAALAAYEPRKRAIRWILDGRVEDYLGWALKEAKEAAHGKRPSRATERERTNAFLEPMALDDALMRDRLDRGDLHDDSFFPGGVFAREYVPHLLESPLEIALRSANDDAFEKWLEAWCQPLRRMWGCVVQSQEFTWSMPFPKQSSLDEILRAARSMPGRNGWGLLSLAFLIGKPERAEMMARRGLCPGDDEEWWSFHDDAAKANQKPPTVLADYAKVETADLSGLWTWMNDKGDLGKELDAELNQRRGDGFDPEEADRRILGLVAKGAPVTGVVLARATERGRLDLLRKLFAAGGDPNCLNHTGVPMLAALGSDSLTVEAAQLWLDAGASPLLLSSDMPFGSDWRPSALYQFAWMGRLDLVEACADRAVAAIAMTYRQGGATYSPLLSIALKRGHADLALWLIREKGCRLNHRDPESDEKCRSFARGDLLAEMEAAEFKLQMQRELRNGSESAERGGM